MSPADPSANRFARLAARAPRLVLAVAAVVFACAVLLASRLELRTAFVELLPSDDPGVVALARTSGRMGDLSLLLIGVRSPSRDANLRYAEELTQRLRKLPPEVVQLATYHVRDLRAFFDDNKWLYLGQQELEDIRDRLRREIAKRKNPLLIDLSDDEESLDELRKRVASKDRLEGRFPGAVFSDKEGSHVWIAALPPGGLYGERAGEALFRAAKRLVGETNPAAFHPDMAVHFDGPVTTLLANREAVERDIIWVTVTCVLVVVLSIGLYFRRLRAIPLIGLPAVVGTVIAFAVAQLAFGYLNSSTAFLGSIIVGNGINYAIILMSRYEEVRAKGHPPRDALAEAIAGVMGGTVIAAISASAAYASLMLTSFRGFYQFGVMGAVGVLACWLSTFTILPALLFLLDRNKRAADSGRAPLDLSRLGRGIGRRPGALLLVSSALTIAAIPGLTYFVGAPFEYDFRKLNTNIESSADAKEFSANKDQLFGRWPSPTAILADSLDEVEPIRKAIRARDEVEPGDAVIGDIITIFDVLPGTPEQQRAKLEVIAQIRKLANDPNLEALDDKEREQLAQVNPPAGLRVLEPKDLPPLARRPFTEVDGTVGRVLLVYPGSGFSIWNGKNLLRIANVLQEIALPDRGKTMQTSGSAVVFSAMIRSVLRDGPIATALSLGAVLLLVLVIMRPARAALTALAALFLGVIWMMGAAGLSQVKITFLNFIALPITFGVGIEYALNVVARHQQNRDMVAAVSSTGGAVALCSWTTIVGYGSLLAARNQALQGFGAMAILGEVACLLAAIVALPSLVLWWAARRRSAA